MRQPEATLTGSFWSSPPFFGLPIVFFEIAHVVHCWYKGNILVLVHIKQLLTHSVNESAV